MSQSCRNSADTVYIHIYNNNNVGDDACRSNWVQLSVHQSRFIWFEFESMNISVHVFKPQIFDELKFHERILYKFELWREYPSIQILNPEILVNLELRTRRRFN